MRQHGIRNLPRRLTSLLLVLVMLLALLPTALAAGPVTVDWTNETIQYIGRWDAEEDCNHSYWGGAYFKVNFTGNTLKLKFTGGCDIMVNVDGRGAVTYWGANGTLDVSHLIDTSKTVHTLQVNSRFDMQEMRFAGLELAEGGETQMPETAAVIEFIGDSITSGYGNPNGASDSYSWLTASSLGYEHVQISYSGISVTDGHGYLGDFGNPSQITQYPMLQPVYYQTDALRDQLKAWNFTGYTPKAIVINLGTNDSTTGVNAETFKTNYETLLELVREKNPESVIFALSPFGGYFHDEVKTVVEAFAATDENTHFVDTAGWLESTDYMDGIHPTNDGQIKAAQKLRAELVEVIGEGTIENTAPTVEVQAAGPHTIPEDIVLQATVRDDGLPNLNTVSTWTVVSKPEGANVTFADEHAAITTATVDKAGTYVFGITASDGDLASVQETVTVTVNAANGTVNYEAESPVNTRKGAGIYVNGAGKTMVYDIGYAWNNTVQFNQVNVPEAGTYDLTFHYATENGKQMRGSVSVNGGETMEVTFPAGATWDTMMTETISVTFDKAQGNTILFGGVDGERAPNLDKITIEGPVVRPATPDISLGSGTYHRTKTAEITCDTEGAAIYYTTDGTEPTNESTPYTAPITVDQSMTLKAIAYAEGMSPSKVRTMDYVIDRSLSFEAEDPMNQRQGAGLLYVAGVSGDWMVYDLWTNPNNYLIFQNIDLDESGVYNLNIHYSTDASNKDMEVDVSVNNGTAQRVSFPGTAHVGDVKTVTISNVQLNEGYNTVKLTNSSSGVNFFDRITLEKVEGEETTVTGVTLNESTLTLTEGGSEQLTATVLPENATNQNVTWSSGNPAVATVEGGLVTAIKAGSATITVTTVDGEKTATCEVTVTAPAHVHTLKEVAAKDPTCTEAGNIQYWYCEGCKGYFRDEQATQAISQAETVLAELGHTGGEATCVKKAVCEVCGAEYGETNPNNHKHVGLVGYRPATVAQAGYTGDQVCQDCETTIVQGKVIPKLSSGSTYPIKPVEPVEPSEPDTTFVDVKVGSWYEEAISYVAEAGLMTGVGNGKFNPDGAVTRAMVWTVLARMDGENTDGGATWYSKAQAWAMETGVSDGTSPMGSITREQLAAMLYRFEGSPKVSGNLSAYPDANQVSDWAVDAMVWATQTGLINGMNGKLSPSTGATRAQLATMLMRFTA